MTGWFKIRLIVYSVCLFAFFLFKTANINVSTYTTSVADPLIYRVPTVFGMDEAPIWRFIEHNIVYTKSKRIILYWEGDGGRDDLADEFIDAVQYAQSKNKQIIVRISGHSVSNHARVLCYINNVSYLNKKANLIFHRPFIRVPLIGTKIYGKSPSLFNPCIQRGYLTTEDVNLIFQYQKRVEYHSDGTKTILPDWK